MKMRLTRDESRKLIFQYRNFSLGFLVFVPLFAIAIVSGALRKKWPPDAPGMIWYGAIGLFLIYLWLGNLGRREELEFNPSEFIYRRAFFGFVRTTIYKAAEMGAPYLDMRRRMAGAYTSIAFNYGGREIYLCWNIDRGEAKEMVGLILRKFPELRWPWGYYAETPRVEKGSTTLDLK